MLCCENSIFDNINSIKPKLKIFRMKTKMITLFIATLLLFANTLHAESKVLLRLNLQKSTTYEMTMNSDNTIDQEMMGQKMKIGQKMKMVYYFQVLDVLPNKNFLIEYSISQIKIDMNVNGQDINMDSESSDTSNPMNASLKSLVGNKLKLEINQKGQVQWVVGLDEFAKKLSGNQQLAQSMPMFTDENNFKSFIGQTFNYFPEGDVAKGNKWSSSFKLPSMMNMETVMNFEVADIKADQVTLDVTSDVNIDAPIEQQGMKMDIKMTGTQTGKMVIDQTDGWLRSSDLTQKLDAKIKMKNPQSGEDMEIPMIVNSVTNITVIKK